MLTKLSRSFSRPAMASYQHFVQSSPDAQFPAENGHYHLYVTYSCPFASSALTARNLKGLDAVVGLSVAHPVYRRTKPDDDKDTHKGWTFADHLKSTFKGYNEVDYPVDDAQKTPSSTRPMSVTSMSWWARSHVVTLWDIKKDTIVSSESADMVRMFNSGFGDLATNSIDLVPAELADELDAVNTGFVQDIATQFFKTTFAATEETLEEETAKLFEAIAMAGEILAKQRFLVGKTVTEADIRIFHTLIRYDVHQKPSTKQSFSDFPNVVNYLRDLYQMPAFKTTVHWDHIKMTAKNFSPNWPEPLGPTIDYEAPHDRTTL